MNLLKLAAICTTIVLAACSPRRENEKSDSFQHFVQYSEFVKDSFYIDIQLPKAYNSNENKDYPTVILLDGNFYFPLMASITREYEVAGLLKPFIVVGIGYKSFQTMDSLRERDYLFPASIPSD